MTKQRRYASDSYADTRHGFAATDDGRKDEGEEIERRRTKTRKNRLVKDAKRSVDLELGQETARPRRGERPAGTRVKTFMIAVNKVT